MWFYLAVHDFVSSLIVILASIATLLLISMDHNLSAQVILHSHQKFVSLTSFTSNKAVCFCLHCILQSMLHDLFPVLHCVEVVQLAVRVFLLMHMCIIQTTITIAVVEDYGNKVSWIWLMKPHDHHHSMCTWMEQIFVPWSNYRDMGNSYYYSLVYLRFVNCRMEVSG